MLGFSQLSVNFAGSQFSFTSHKPSRFCIVLTVSLSFAEQCRVSSKGFRTTFEWFRISVYFYVSWAFAVLYCINGVPLISRTVSSIIRRFPNNFRVILISFNTELSLLIIFWWPNIFQKQLVGSSSFSSLATYLKLILQTLTTLLLAVKYSLNPSEV